MIIVEAKGPPDPVQQALRQYKKEWNKTVSSFIDQLIEFKKLMNGQINSFHNEKSKIINPIPADPGMIISSLASEFSDIVNNGNNIIQKQIDYSKTRKKKTSKPTATTAPPDILSQQLSAATFDDSGVILKEGSNMFSRFFTYLLNPTLGSSEETRIRKYRMSMLRASVILFKDLKKLQTLIMKSSPESIFESSKLLNKIVNDWKVIKIGIQTYENGGGTQSSVGGKISMSDVAVDQIISDFKSNASNLGVLKKDKLLSLIVKYKDTIQQHDVEELKSLPQLSKDIISEYKKILLELNTKYNVEMSSLGEIWSHVKPKDVHDESKDIKDPKGKVSVPKKLDDISGTLSPKYDHFKSIYDDFMIFFISKDQSMDVADLVKLMNKTNIAARSDDEEKFSQLFPKVQTAYYSLLEQLTKAHGQKFKSLKDFISFNKSKKSDKYSDEELIASGNISLGQFFGRMKHRISPFDQSSAQRLDVDKLANYAKQVVDQIMNSLENELSVAVINDLGFSLEEILKKMQVLMYGLQTTISGKGFEKPFIDLLETGKATQMESNLSDKQKEQLQKMVENKHLRDLTKLY